MPTINTLGTGNHRLLTQNSSTARTNLSSRPTDKGSNPDPSNALHSDASNPSPSALTVIQSVRHGSQDAFGTPTANTYEYLAQGISQNELSTMDRAQTLRRLQELMVSNKSYSLEAEREIVKEIPPQATANGGLPSVRTDDGYNKPQELTISVNTKDGDTIRITIADSRVQGDGSRTYDRRTVSFEIDGELDKEEFEALSALTEKIGYLAEDYSADDWVTLGQFDAFDESELKQFTLDIKGEGEHVFSIDYAVNENLGTRTLSANQNGYEFDLTVNLDGLMLDSDIAGNSQYQQYRTLIQSTSLSYQSGTEDPLSVSRFFQEGLDALFQVHTDRDATEPDKEEEESTDTTTTAIDNHIANNAELLDTFSSGLSDFTASFRAPKVVTNQGEVLMMKLDFSQTTTIEQHGDRNYHYQQDSEFSSFTSQIAGFKPWAIGNESSIPSQEPDDVYTYVTEEKSELVSRSLDFENENDLTAIREIRHFDYRREEITKHLGSQGSSGKDNDATVIDKAFEADSDQSELSFQVANTPEKHRWAELKIGNYMKIKDLDFVLDGKRIDLFR